MDFPWIGCVFLLLHSLVFVMKQYSYAFYNGYLWNCTEGLHKIEGRIKKREDQTSNETDTALEEMRSFLQEELEAQSTTLPFPQNISFQNYFTYSMFPTLVYQIDYPRKDKIDWKYVAEKIAATFGVFMLMIVLAENYLYPIAMRALALRHSSFYERCLAYPPIMADLLMP